jgi:hypothetical protein
MLCGLDSERAKCKRQEPTMIDKDWAKSTAARAAISDLVKRL